ncbi:MAG: VIT domain-containing protein [Gemmatimonadaceae bacterium]
MAAAFASLLSLVPSLAEAQSRPRPPEDCGRRECIAAPCPQPRCVITTVQRVERTGREVRVTLEGRVLRYEVTERWTNRGHMVGEADYVLPLPKGAAFEDLALEIDGELVTGEALDANKARRVYEEIVRQRKDPALVEWMGLGVLRTRIFPIAPGETRTVVVRFRAVAEREGDALRVDVPAPRGNGTMASGTALSLRWPAGEAFGEAWSPTHRVEVSRDGSRRVAKVDDANGTVTLLVPVRAGSGAAISMLAHAPNTGEGYALITLTPPVLRRAAAARDITFVLDVSGSMSGGKLEQAKAAGRQLLNSLSSGDRFRLIAFSNDVEEFRDGWSTASATDRRAAERWLRELRASGGTNIGGALERALEPSTRAGRLAMVLFMTDGAPTVGERRGEKLAARAAELRGERRIFTFGLGADVNAALLEQVALDGAGTAHFVRPEEDVERVVGVVAERLTRPVATDLRIRAEGVTLHAVQPAGRLDLFAGQELVVLARYRGHDERSGRITITGNTPDGPVTWQSTVRFPARRTSDAFVGRLWATQRVGWLSAERRKNGASREVDAEIRELGERWGIPTELTSYLVLEPGMDATVAQQGSSVIPTSQPRDRRALAQGAAANAASQRASAPAPAVAFESAKAAATMREARSLADVSAATESDANSRQTSTRRFVQRDGLWLDTRSAARDARIVKVRPYSAAYFAAMDRVAELREAFALGERVEVHGRAVTVILAADGVDDLDNAALAALTRDW